MKFILIVTEEASEKTKYFGPFDDGEKALDWGEEHFDSKEYFLMSTTLYDPKKRNKIMCYCNNSWICDICIIVCLIGCFFLGWAFGVKHMRQQAVSFNVATYQANESGGPEFVWKNMEKK